MQAGKSWAKGDGLAVGGVNLSGSPMHNSMGILSMMEFASLIQSTAVPVDQMNFGQNEPTLEIFFKPLAQ